MNPIRAPFGEEQREPELMTEMEPSAEEVRLSRERTISNLRLLWNRRAYLLIGPSFGWRIQAQESIETPGITTETELSMDGDSVRAYRENLRQYLERVETFCRTKEIGYHRLTSDSPVDAFVLAQLRGRVVA